MEKEKHSNRPLILSIISITVCVVLLIGATMAWFTDTETNTGNRIQAGTLDVELWMYTGNAGVIPTAVDTVNDWKQITDDSDPNSIFGEAFENWEPGDEADMYFAVVNKGSLDVNYTLDLVVTDDDLADAIQFKAAGSNDGIAAPTDGYATISSVIGDDNTIPIMNKEQTHTLNGTSSDASKDTMYITMNLKFDESSGNKYQGLAFAMDVILTATQTNVEEATVVKAYDIDDIKAAEEDQTVILMNDITDENAAIELKHNVNFDLNGYTLKVKSFSMETDDYCTVDIADGEIIATGTIGSGTYSDKGVLINISKGTVNMLDSVIKTANGVVIDASTNTLNLLGTTQFSDLGGSKISAQILSNTRVVVATTVDTSVTVSDNVTVEDARETQSTNTITVSVPANTSNVVINNSSETANSIVTAGDGMSDVTMQEDGEVQLTASEQFIADLESAEDGGLVTLTDDVTISEDTYVGKGVNINLNGYTLTIDAAFVIDYSRSTVLKEGDIAYIANGVVTGYAGSTGATFEDGTKNGGSIVIGDKGYFGVVAKCSTTLIIKDNSANGGSQITGFDAGYDPECDAVDAPQKCKDNDCTIISISCCAGYVSAGTAYNTIIAHVNDATNYFV